MKIWYAFYAATPAKPSNLQMCQIAGKIKTRFRYTKVPACDYGMSVEEILNMPDKELNQRVSMKKLHPYRKDVGDNTPWWKR